MRWASGTIAIGLIAAAACVIIACPGALPPPPRAPPIITDDVACPGDDVAFAPPPVDAGPVFEREPCEPPALVDASGTLCAGQWCFEHPSGGALARVVASGVDAPWVGFARFDGAAMEDVPFRGMPFGELPLDGVPSAFVPRSLSTVADDDAWAIVGDGPIHYDGEAWRFDATRACRNIPTSIFALASNDVWMTGLREQRFDRIERVDPDTVAHYDGSSWSSVDVPDAVTFVDVHGLSSDDLWFVGNTRIIDPANAAASFSAGVLGHWDGTSLSTRVRSDVQSLSAVHISANGELWAAGARLDVEEDETRSVPVILRGTSALCDVEDAPCLFTTLEGAAGSSIVWGLCDDGVVARHDGSDWQLFDDVVASSLAVQADDDVWTDVAHFDGTGFSSPVPFGPSASGDVVDLVVTDVGAASALAVTPSAVLERVDDKWLRVDIGGALAGFLHVDANDGVAMALAPDGIAMFDGSTWRTVDAPPPLQLIADFCVVSATEAYAVDGNPGFDPGEGENETGPGVARFDGATWDVELLDGAFAVFCAGPDEVVASGASGVHVRATDGTWSTSTLPFVTQDLLYISPQFRPQLAYGHSPQSLWVAGGALFDGSEWRRESPATSTELVAFATRGADGDTYTLRPVNRFDADVAPHTILRVADDGALTPVGSVDVLQPQKMFGSPSGALWIVSFGALIRVDLDGSTQSFLIPDFGITGDLWLADDAFALTWRHAPESLLVFDGATWSTDDTFPAPITGDFTDGVMDLFGFARDDVWAAYGRAAEVAHFDGQTWTVIALAGGVDGEGIYAIWGVASDDVWVLGRQGSLWRGNIESFELIERGPGPFVQLGTSGERVVVASAADDVWFVPSTFSGLIVAHWDGTTLTHPAVLPAVVHAKRIEDELVIVDRDGFFWRRDPARFVFTGERVPLEASVDRGVLLTARRSGRARVTDFLSGQTSFIRFSAGNLDETLTLDSLPFGPAPPIVSFDLDTVLLAGAANILVLAN